MTAISLKSRPLTQLLGVTSLASLMLLAPGAQARLIDSDTVIDSRDPLDSYQVSGSATLTANGAATREISAASGSTVILNGSTVDTDTSAAALSLDGAKATITGSTLTSTSSRGLGLGPGAEVLASDSIITGATRGATVNNSVLNVLSSEVRGTGATSLGLELFDGTVNANASHIVGGQHGVLIRGDSGQPAGQGKLVLDASHVEGQNGAAIVVGIGAGRPVKADIEVRNGSLLTASNGVLLQVAEDASATLRVNNSQLIGDIIVASTGNADITFENAASFSGRLENVAKLQIDSGASWTLVGDSQVGDLAMGAGSVRFGNPGDFFTLTVANLQGAGTFEMKGDFATGQADFLDVTGVASGAHQIAVSSSGSDPLAEASLHLVRIGAGDASFDLLGGPVDLGAYSYDLVRSGNDWFLDASRKTISPGTRSVMALNNAIPTVFYGELSTLRSRLGEVRRDPAKAGGWIRTYGNKFNVAASAGTAYQQTQQGISLGVDRPVAAGDGNWLVGVSAGYSKSDLDLGGGTSGEVDSFHAGVYSTWLAPLSGYYFDAVGKLNRYQNQADVRLNDGQESKGDYANHGLGLSLEFGRHLRLGDGYFVEPYAQLAGMLVQGNHYTLDNGMRADGERARSLLGKLGATAGRTFDLGDGRMIQPYLRLAAAREFARNNEVRVNDNRFANDLSGTRGELGAGVSLAWSDNWQVHADFDYSNGDKIEQPWGADIGVRYSW